MDYDVVVVGAGPSGSTAARTLAEKGINVLLLDKERFPRDKPCGGGLPIRTLTRFPYLKEVPFIESYTYGGVIFSPSSTYHTTIIKKEPVIAMVQRSTFDNELVKQSIDKGATFKDNKKVSDIKITTDHAHILCKDGTSIFTELIIGADGCHSTIARKMNIRPSLKGRGICIVNEYPLSEETIKRFYTENNLCYLHSRFQGIHGYGWVFPKQHHVNIGIISYDSKQELRTKNHDLKTVYSKYLSLLKDQSIIPKEIDETDVIGGTLPVRPLSKTYFDRLLLCGDAAGLINPISGEGIYYALVSGEIAGNIAYESIRRKDTTEQYLMNYEKQWKQEFGKEIRFFYKMKKQWGRQGDRMVKLMNNDPLLAEMIFLVMIGKESAYEQRYKIIKRFIYSSLFKRRRITNADDKETIPIQ